MATFKMISDVLANMTPDEVNYPGQDYEVCVYHIGKHTIEESYEDNHHIICMDDEYYAEDSDEEDDNDYVYDVVSGNAEKRANLAKAREALMEAVYKASDLLPCEIDTNTDTGMFQFYMSEMHHYAPRDGIEYLEDGGQVDYLAGCLEYLMKVLGMKEEE